jgi:hypothetical protein
MYSYVVGLGSGVLKSESGELTQAGRNVVDKCFSLYHLESSIKKIILIGGRPWKYPPFTDAELMHERLLKLGENMRQLQIPKERIVVLNGNNTREQTLALRAYLSDHPQERALLICPRMQSRRLRALLKKQGLLPRCGIKTVDDGCEPERPVEKFRWSERRYFIREILAYVHHKLNGWI